MVSVSESTADELETIAENQGVNLDVVRETFKDKYEDVEERASGLDDERLEQLALRATRTSALSSNRVSTEGVELLTIGGSVRDWNQGDTFVGKALVDQNPNSDGGVTNLATVIVDESDVEISEVYDAFSELGNVVVGEFSVSEAEIGDFLVLNSSEDTEIEVNRPDDRGPLLSEIRDAVPETSIADIGDDLSARTRNDDGELYAASFGVDIRRIEGDVYDAYKDVDGGFGIYTIRDETVFDEEDVRNSDVHSQSDDDNENAVPGLTCWTDPEKMSFGSESVVEFYGVVSQDDDGQVVMNVDGMVPIYATDFDGYEAQSNGDAGSTQDVDTSNVDRTKI